MVWCGLYSDGLNSDGLYSDGLYSDGLYSDGLYEYGVYSYDKVRCESLPLWSSSCCLAGKTTAGGWTLTPATQMTHTPTDDQSMRACSRACVGALMPACAWDT